jgi:uncharacterized membrane protein YdjX (TVP38/TMEM64 family)
VRKKHLAAGFIGILSLIALLLVVIFFNPYKLNSALEFTSEHLIIGAIFLIVLRTISNVLPVIPGGMIVFASIPILGWFLAFICNAIGILIGKSMAFFLARIYREPLVERFTSLRNIHKLEKQLSGKKQFLALVAFKLFTVPVVDISSYVIGLSGISFAKFFLATFLASLPTITFYYFGSEVYEKILGKNLSAGIIMVLISGSIYFIIRKYRSKSKIKI